MKTKIAYICHFSTPPIRERLHLKSLFWTNLLRRVVGIPKLEYCDSGTWNADFIKAFENNKKYECYVIGHHFGMRDTIQRFVLNGINYNFFQEKEHIHKKILSHLLHKREEESYAFFLHQIKSFVDAINPDLVIICGAENAIYSPSALFIKNKPIFVFLQTLLNLPKRVEMGIGTLTRRKIEDSVIKHSGYFGTIEFEELEYIKKRNPHAECLKLMFPLADPKIDSCIEKDFDFVFFANGLSKHKGTEDALRGFVKVCKAHRNATFVLIGTCIEEYKTFLNNILEAAGIKDNVTFIEHFPLKTDVLKQITKAKYVVLPSITAALNSTVREAMYIGLPTIVYETSVTRVINQQEINLLEAKMEDVDDLGKKMLFAYEHPNDMEEMAKRAKLYAKNNFSTEAVAKIIEEDVDAIMNHYYHQVPIPNHLLLDK